MNGPTRKLTLQEFLDWESHQPGRNEFHRGEVFAVPCVNRGHGCVVANLLWQLGNQLAETSCQVFSQSLQLQIADEAILYPDVFVTCDRGDLQTDMIFRAPTVVVEVLSASTQAYDRSEKFALYRRVASLKEYVLIDPDTRRVDVFRPGADGQWALHDVSESGHLSLPSIGCEIAMADLFAGLEPGL